MELHAYLDPGHFRAASAEHCVVVADVRDSTQAIASGHYKAVNIVGAAVIAAVAAVAGGRVPYVFGGDGASLLVPRRRHGVVRAVLADVVRMARERFRLRVSAGVVPVPDLLEMGKPVLVASMPLSPYYEGTLFSGGGLAAAEAHVKEERTDYAVHPERHWRSDLRADFSSLECRWHPIRPGRDFVLSVLIVAHPALNLVEGLRLYREVAVRIAHIVDGLGPANPLIARHMHLALDPRPLSYERRVRTYAPGSRGALGYGVGLLLLNLLGKCLMALKVKTAGVDWGAYKDRAVCNCDYCKFDDALRMTLAVTERQARDIESLLQGLHEERWLSYGLHRNEASLITCLIEDYDTRHFHFVDGSDGGYALASVGLKRQMKALSARPAPA